MLVAPPPRRTTRRRVALVVVVLVAAVAPRARSYRLLLTHRGNGAGTAAAPPAGDTTCPAPPHAHTRGRSGTSSGRAGRCCAAAGSIYPAPAHRGGGAGVLAAAPPAGIHAPVRLSTLCTTRRGSTSDGHAGAAVAATGSIFGFFSPTGTAVLVQRRLRRLEYLACVQLLHHARTTQRSSTSSVVLVAAVAATG